MGGILIIFLLLFGLFSLSIGGHKLSLSTIYQALIGKGGNTAELIIWNIRLPRILAAIIAGISLAVSGAVMQCTLRNPLASPYTIGISHGAMFGAAVAIILFGIGGAESTGKIFINSPYLITVFAFLGSFVAVLVILLLAKLKNFAPETIILAGVTMSSLFTAGTMVMQYFANDLQLAAMVYWSFGDLGRPHWVEVGIMAVFMILSVAYFIYKRWDYNALESGEESAKSLGVNTKKTRLLGMLVASLLVSVNVAFLGIIGFVGLICPHLVRILIGGDYRFIIPISALIGALLLLISDTVARTIISPIILPVGILTSFLGAPVFLYLLIKRYR
ncbi:MAG: iron ABC transporter permease [Atribacterota bacterium]|nr:iron ABC transporter permease [Atribacterota bacterium]MDD4895236.1 iron ABC transporter permease [Atribacterota bacterium]MDD5637002.1 iron ABC transporter permease [Atribacterota bacterium]